MSISCYDFRSILENEGVSAFNLIVTDKEYSCPTLEWIVEKFLPYFDAVENRQYQPEAFDCEDFVRSFIQRAVECHAKTFGHPETGLAVAGIVFTEDFGGGHAVGCFIVKRDGVHVPIFIGAQPPSRVRNLSADEKSNVFGITTL